MKSRVITTRLCLIVIVSVLLCILPFAVFSISGMGEDKNTGLEELFVVETPHVELPGMDINWLPSIYAVLVGCSLLVMGLISEVRVGMNARRRACFTAGLKSIDI